MAKRIKLLELSQAELTSRIAKLLEVIQALADIVQRQEEGIARLKDEIAVLKKQKKRPKQKPAQFSEPIGC